MVWVLKDEPVKSLGESKQTITPTAPSPLLSSTKVLPRPMNKVDAVVTEFAQAQIRKARPGRPSQRSRERSACGNGRDTRA